MMSVVDPPPPVSMAHTPPKFNVDAKPFEMRASSNSSTTAATAAADLFPAATAYAAAADMFCMEEEADERAPHLPVSSSSSNNGGAFLTDAYSEAGADGLLLVACDDAAAAAVVAAAAAADDEEEFVPPDDALRDRIVRQVEFYFSDVNLTKDAFLLKHVKRNKDGHVSLKLIASFKKVKSLTKDWRVVAYSLRSSERLTVNATGTKVGRRDPLPPYDETTPTRTVIATNLPMERPSVESVAELFAKCGEIALVRILRPLAPVPPDLRQFVSKHPGLGAGVCAVIEFAAADGAQRAVRDMGGKNSDWRSMHVVEMAKGGVGGKNNNNNGGGGNNSNNNNGGMSNGGCKKDPSSSPPNSEDGMIGGRKDGGDGPALLLADKKKKRNKKRNNAAASSANSNAINGKGDGKPQQQQSGSADCGGGGDSTPDTCSPRGGRRKAHSTCLDGGPLPLTEQLNARLLFHPESKGRHKSASYSEGSSQSLCGGGGGGGGPGSSPPSADGSPWVRRRRLAAKENGQSPLAAGASSAALNSNKVPEGVVRLPRGPDGTDGFHGGARGVGGGGGGAAPPPPPPPQQQPLRENALIPVC